MLHSVTVNNKKASGLLPDRFWEGEGSPRHEQQDNAAKVVEQQYQVSNAILGEFWECLPGIMTTKEYAKSLAREDLAIEQPPSAKEFVEHVLVAESTYSEGQEEEEEEITTEYVYKEGFKFVHITEVRQQGLNFLETSLFYEASLTAT